MYHDALQHLWKNIEHHLPRDNVVMPSGTGSISPIPSSYQQYTNHVWHCHFGWGEIVECCIHVPATEVCDACYFISRRDECLVEAQGPHDQDAMTPSDGHMLMGEGLTWVECIGLKPCISGIDRKGKKISYQWSSPWRLDVPSYGGLYAV